ncbi:MAG: ribosome maturation factor RimM [Lactobacillaceae bacterium]|nr:ribosome maturation factor RimM [Lactobacillaceae bacterium]
MNNFFKVGTIVNTHGIKGDLKVISNTDFADKRFKRNSKLIIGGNEYTVKNAKPNKGTYLLSFFEFNDINDAEKLKGQDIYVNGHTQDNLSEDEFYYDQIIGLPVYDESNIFIGNISNIISLASNDVWTILSPLKKEILIPYIDDVVKKVDLKNSKIQIQIIEGLIDEN